MLLKDIRVAADDISRALKLYKTWSYLAYQDVIARYRRSLLGPFWIAAGTVAQALSMSIVYGAIMRQPLAELLPYIMGGLLIFNFLGIPFNEGCETFSGAATTIRTYPLPLAFHMFRMMIRNFVQLAHSAAVYFIVVLLLKHSISVTPMIIPGLILMILFVMGASAISSIAAMRFRDIRFLLPYAWQILFFSTPVFWKAESISKAHRFIFEYNPFYYLIEIVRRPLLGEPVAPHIWPVAIAIVCAVMPIGFLVFATFRKRIALWI
jgi:ABC-type polysaccharide/polyol phosphate export permease